jgi:hypothetical protein
MYKDCDGHMYVLAASIRHVVFIVFVSARCATALIGHSQQGPGAVHVQAKNVDDWMNRLHRDRTLVTCCTCSDEKTGARVSRELKERDFRRSTLYGVDSKPGGTQACTVEAIPEPE